MTRHTGEKITVIRNSHDPVAFQEPVNWALSYFRKIVEDKWLEVDVAEHIAATADAVFTIKIGSPALADSEEGHFLTDEQKPVQPESFVIQPVTRQDHGSLLVLGADAQALVYALLELADKVELGADPLHELQNIEAIKDEPANPVRSIKRLFVNEKLDKKWFYDEGFWREYLSELALQRFNRFSLALGMGYDLGHDPNIKDFYFCFAYPFLVSVPGYDVHVEGLTEAERNKNLKTLRFIGREARRRGLEFQVGLWTHAFEPEESPDLRYKIQGVNEENHAGYCRDAIKTLLQQCPEITGLTIRVHYESGIPEPAHLFWKEVLQGVPMAGREIKLDLHPKGIDDELLQVAEENGVPFTISPKFWAEHMGLPYHQAAIRETELPVEPTPEAGNMIITTTSRRFTRYGYADFLKEDRAYDMFFRIWPGTQRVLLWGDPEMAAGYGRSGSFSGSKGIELMEPLSFKSRKTSETAAGRDPYSDPALRLDGGEWRKYLYSYRLWGRLLYNPDADPETWRRYLRNEFDEAAEACEHALAYASRILPLLTVAHMPSVANNNYWPEIYSNIFIIDQKNKPAYHCDGRDPDTFNEVSPLDSELFYRIDEFTEDMAADRRTGKISPVDTADRLEGFASSAQQFLAEAQSKIKDERDPAFRRLAIDVEIQIGLGLFFADKFRAGTAYAFFEKTRNKVLLDEALAYYRSAKKSWGKIAEAASPVYTDDITFGYVPFMRGHWADRMPGIEEDIVNMEKQEHLAKKDPSREETERARSWLKPSPKERKADCGHVPPASFKRGEGVKIAIEVPESSGLAPVLKYRVANQAESYQSINMEQQEKGRYTAAIPSSYTDSAYPLIYFFELEDEEGEKSLFPGFEESMCNQPYFLLRQDI